MSNSSKPPAAAPRPWAYQFVGAHRGAPPGHLYLVDATGRKIAVIWGKAEEKAETAQLILDAVEAWDAGQEIPEAPQ